MMAATQASAKQTSLMLGNDSLETRLVLKTFYSRRDEQRLDRNGGVRVCGDSKQSQDLSLNNWSNATKDHMFPRYPPSKPSIYMDTLPLRNELHDEIT